MRFFTLKYFKKTAAVIAALCLLLAFTGCGGESSTAPDTSADASQAEKTKINIAALKGPTGIGMVRLMEQNEAGSAANDYNFTVSGAPDEVTTKVINGEYDIAALPTNVASLLYNKTKGEVLMLALNTKGVLYMLDSTGTVNSVADLKGKKIYATGQGSTPEYVLNYILSENGIDPAKDVTVEYLSEHSELAALIASGEAQIALLPEPNVTSVLSSNSNVKIALNMTEEWDRIAGKDENDGSILTMGCVVVRKEFAEQNADAVKAFLEEYKASVEYTSTNLDETAQLCEYFEIIPKAAVAKKAIPNCNIFFAAGSDMKDYVDNFYKVLYSYNPASIGGTLPDDGIYYAE